MMQLPPMMQFNKTLIKMSKTKDQLTNREEWVEWKLSLNNRNWKNKNDRQVKEVWVKQPMNGKRAQ